MFRKHALARGYEILVIFVAIVMSCVILFVFFARQFGPETGERAKQASQEAYSESGGKSFKIMEISIEDGTDSMPGSIDYVYIHLKLSPGSEWISLNRTLLDLEIEENRSTSYIFSSAINCSSKNQSDPLSIYNSTNNGKFGMEYIFRGSDERGPGVLTENEIGLLCFKTPRSLSNDENFRLTIVPSRGVPFYYEQSLPQNLNKQKTVIYKRA